MILALYLDQRGFGAAAIGAVFTATMVEDAVLTMLLSTVAERVGLLNTMVFTHLGSKPRRKTRSVSPTR